MIVICRCGKRRTAQPYKDARTIKVDGCVDCREKRKVTRVVHRRVGGTRAKTERRMA